MTHKLNSAILRRWAMQCAASADGPSSNSDKRQHLLRMRVSLLDLADAQDWLERQSADVGIAAQRKKQGVTVVPITGFVR